MTGPALVTTRTHRKPSRTPLAGAPVAAGTQIVLGWHRGHAITLDLGGASYEWASDLFDALLDVRAALAEQEAARKGTRS